MRTKFGTRAAAIALIVAMLVTGLSTVVDAGWARAFSNVDLTGDDLKICIDEITLAGTMTYQPDTFEGDFPGFSNTIGELYPGGPTDFFAPNGIETIELYDDPDNAADQILATAVMEVDFALYLTDQGDSSPGVFERYKFGGQATIPTASGINNGDSLYVYQYPADFIQFTVGAAKYNCGTCDGQAATVDMNDPASGSPTSGPDVILGTGGADIINGLGGDDLICAGLGGDVINGGIGNDRIFGGAGPDRIFGDPGNDTIYGEAGWDTLDGSLGNDTVYGGDGNDVMFGGWGDDAVYGQNGNDLLLGFGGVDDLQGGAGNDRINGQGGNDVIFGGGGSDQMWGSFGNDTMGGGDGWDALFGGWGNDILSGAAGNDTLWGEANDDTIDGGTGNDNLQGGWANDTLTGGAGTDLCNGDIGIDSAATCETIQNVP